MKIIDLEQGTPEWLAWRKTKITATDMAGIMGLSPYKTPLQVYNEKKSQELKPHYVNKYMERGTRLEPKAREWASATLGIDFKAACVESGVFGASLDGLCFVDGIYRMLEIKTPGDNVLEKALEWDYPIDWVIQTQTQLSMSNDLQFLNLCIYNEDERKRSIHTVLRNDEIIKQIENAGNEFMHRLINNDPPEPTEFDYIKTEANEYQQRVIKHLAELQIQLKLLTALEKDYRDQVCSMTDDGNTIITDDKGKQLAKLTRVNREGNVDWKKLTDDKGITDEDIQKYRKSGIGYWKIILANE